MRNPIRKTVHSVRDAARTQLWPIPTLGVIAAVLLGIMIPALDAVADGHLPDWLDAVVFGGDAGAASTVLDAVSSSLITVTALTFSLTVVTLQLASTQFSPRLLRTFTQDLFVQVTLAIFLATFAFSLTVLRSVRSSGESIQPFVPRIAVTVSFLLALASLFALVLFLAHLTRQIRVETILEKVHADAAATAEANLVRRDAERPLEPPVSQPHTAVRVRSASSGFLLRIDEARLVDAASSVGAVIRVDRIPGSFIVANTPVAHVWHTSSRELSPAEYEELEACVHAALHFGQERTAAQDVGFGLRQLVDVANKALSPSMNDPTTAIHALGHISAVLSEIAQYRLGPVRRTDGDGVVRLECARPTFSQYLDTAINQPRHYGGSDPFVTIRLLQLLQDLAWTVAPEHHATIRMQLQRLRDTANAQNFDAAERAQQMELVAEIETALAMP